MIVEAFPDRTIIVDQKEYSYFGGTSYLGMATHPQFQKTLNRSIKKWGTAYGSSRNANVRLSIYSKAEKLLAKRIGSEDCVTVSSGTLAGRLVTDCLSRTIKTFYHYPKTHPAILYPISIPLFVNGELHPKLLNSKVETIAITVDAVLSLEVQPTSFDFLNDVSSQKAIILLIDESHSLGLLGKNGEGIFGALSHPKIHRKIMVSSLTKALGCTGGVIAADKDFIELIKSDAIFVSSSSMNPFSLQGLIDSEELFIQQRERLRQNLNFFFDALELDHRFKFNKGYPVIYCSENAVFDYLKSRNIIIANFKYPNYDNDMNRIVITANHTKEDLSLLQHALASFQNKTLH